MATNGSNMRLPRSTPEARGLSTSAISAFLDDVDEKIFDLHSLMIVRHGKVVAEGWWEPYGPDIPHVLYSLSKSFVSSAIGLAVDEGLLTIDDPVINYFPDETPSEVSENLAAMKIRHLLSMNTGHDIDSTEFLDADPDGNWAQAFLARPVEHEPGSFFVYNSGASYMLSAIVQKLTDQTVLEYLTPRLFEPLGIQNPTWQVCPRGVNVGGWGLNITTEDIACFGQMLLQRGQYNDRQILPSEWIALASSFHSDNSISRDQIDWQQGYGFQFWLCRHNAYRGDGAFGQYCVVMPEQDAVFAATSGVDDMQAVMDLVWNDLLPAMEADALPEAPEALAALNVRLENLALPICEGVPSSDLEESLNGKKYAFESNTFEISAMQFSFDNKACHLSISDPNGEHKVTCKRGQWSYDTLGLTVAERHFADSIAVAATCCWTDDDTLLIKLCLYETPHTLSFSCTFKDGSVEVKPSMNVSFSEEDAPTMVGTAV